MTCATISSYKFTLGFSNVIEADEIKIFVRLSLSSGLCLATCWPKSLMGQWIEEAHLINNRWRITIQRLFIFILWWSAVYLISDWFLFNFSPRVVPSAVGWELRPCACCLLDKWHMQRVYMAYSDGHTSSDVSKWDCRSVIKCVL